VQLFEPQIAQFGNAQTGSVAQLQDGLLAKRGGRLDGQGREQLFDLRVGERLGQTFPTARQRKILRDIGRQQLFIFREPIEGAQRGDLQVKAFGTEPSQRVLFLILELARPLVLQELHEMPQFDLFPIGKILLGGPLNETFQQSVVSLLRVLGLTALVPQRNQKVIDELFHGRSDRHSVHR
jgi:hypothetical protein